MYRRSKLICLTLVIIALLCTPLTSYAATTTITGKTVLPEAGQEFRYLKTVDTKWTGAKYVSGQAKNGYYLKKGDLLYYSESGGSNSATVSVSVGYGGVSVGVSVPLGKKTSNGVGTGLRVPQKGWYKIKANKQVKVTVKTTQVRNVKYNASTKEWEPVSGSKGKWRNVTVTSKKYTTLRVKPTLVKQ